MSKKYFVYLDNDRKVGPFTREQIGILYLKGHIKGTEFCETFPHK